MKTYVKPQIRYENFALSESVAACNADDGWIYRGNQDKTNCYMETNWSEFENVNPFTTSGNCNYTETEESCYMLWNSAIGAGYGSV